MIYIRSICIGAFLGANEKRRVVGVGCSVASSIFCADDENIIQPNSMAIDKKMQVNLRMVASPFKVIKIAYGQKLK